MGVKIRNSEVRIERNNRMSSISTKLKEFVDLCLENDRNCIAKIIDGKEVLFVENDEGKYDIALHIKGIGEKILSFNKSIWVTKSQKRFIENKKCKVVYNFYGDWILSDVKQILVSKAKDENDNEGYQAVINFDSFDFSKKKNTKEKFVHLHNHFEYSQLDGTLSAKQWISHCVKNGIDSIALTDHGTLSGSLDFYLEAKKKNIKPILGLEAYITKDLENDRKETRHLTLLARNNIGWRNLLKLNTFAQVKGFYYKPRITYKELMKRGNGLIILTGCPSSLFSKYLFEAKLKKAIELYEYYCECVGEENVYLEYQYHNFKNNLNIKAQEQYHTNFYLVLKTLKSIRKPKVVVTNDCHYILPDDFSVWEAISKISNVKSDEDSSQVLDDLYLKTRKQIIKEFQQTKLFKKSLVTLDEFIQWCDNTIEIANKCNVEIPIGQHNLPEFPFDENKFKDKEELFDKIIKDGFDLKVVRQWNPKIRHSAKHTVKDYKKRLQMEVDVIKKAGFIDYFLIIWDIIKSAKDNGIFVGAARGSVAGSLCAYVMDITDIDPLKFDLLFERFLNETRVSGERAKEADALPDIDMDFESKGRDWVKHYVENKYGNMNVCSLATYGRLQLRAAIKDIGKTYGGLSFDYLNSITGRVHGQEKEDLVEAIVKNKEVEQFVDDNPDVMKIVYRCMGQVRHSSIHPAGMIISPKHRKTSKGKIVDASLDDFIPVKVIKTKDTKEDVLVSEWEGGFVERRGLLKIDVLGIKQLDIFKNILSMIKDKIDLNFIDLEDDKVFEKFRRGDTEGVFQFKSRIQKDYQKKLQPDTFEHLIASNALLRPGAMSSDAHNDFVAFKNGDKVPHYDEGLEKVTEKTQGLYVYQEQIMQAMVVGGGLSLAEADVVRTAIKKFDKEKMGKFKDKFIKGIKKIHKYNDKDAKEVWDKLMAFSGYGFNKSHSCSYALIGYQCVIGTTLLYDWDKKEYVTISKAYKEGIKNIACYDIENNKTISGKVKKIIRTTGAKNLNKKEGYKILTKSQKSLIASAEHKILIKTENKISYKKVIDIDVDNDLIACEKRVSVSNRKDVSENISKGVKRYWDKKSKTQKRRRMKNALSVWNTEKLSNKAKEQWKKYPFNKRRRIIKNLISGSNENNGYKKCFRGKAKDGHFVFSKGELFVDNWLYKNKLEHKTQIFLENNKVADFYCKGIYIEYDGLKRDKKYFKNKFKDLPYIVLTRSSLKNIDNILDFLLQADEIKIGKEIIFESIKKIEKLNKKFVMYDVVMEKEPHNFLANNIVVHNCQWLKTYYPKEFWTVNLEFADEDDRMNYVNRIMNDYQDIQITFPDINYSNDKMKLFDNEIVWGLRHIKGVGDKGAEAIYQERKKNGKYKSLEDFVNRVQKRIVNKRVVLALIYAGAFDNMFGLNEGDDNKRFAIKTEYFKIKKEKEVLQYEGDVFYKTEYKRLLGINIIDWETLIKHNKLDSENDYISIYENWELVDEKSKCLVAGIVTKITERQTKKGSKFGIVELQQQGVSLDVLIWGDYWEDENYKDKIKIGRYIAIRGYKTFDSYRSNYNLQTKSGVTKLWRLKTKKM